MTKVAAILDTELRDASSVKITKSYVDRRYVYKTDKGWFGINTYAS
jgi:hypothetical protein